MSTPEKKTRAKAEKKHIQKRSIWQVQTAKARFSELLRRAHAEGPQIVTRQGKEEVVILPVEQYRKLTRRGRAPEGLAAFFAHSPLAGAKLDLERQRDYGREIEL